MKHSEKRRHRSVMVLVLVFVKVIFICERIFTLNTFEIDSHVIGKFSYFCCLEHAFSTCKAGRHRSIMILIHVFIKVVFVKPILVFNLLAVFQP